MQCGRVARRFGFGFKMKRFQTADFQSAERIVRSEFQPMNLTAQRNRDRQAFLLGVLWRCLSAFKRQSLSLEDQSTLRDIETERSPVGRLQTSYGSAAD